jgi:septal ring factor EnvC (AmiA/AmiB activator)
MMASRTPARRLAFVAIVAVVTLAAGAASAAAPAPFPMPLDSGTKYVAELADARAELARAQPEVGRVQQRQQTLQGQYDALTAQLAALDAQEKAAAVQVQAARDRIASSAAKQYVEAGGTRVNAAMEVALNANDMLDFGRNLHILEKSGTHEVDLFSAVDAAHTAIVTQMTGVFGQQASTKRDLDAAIKKVKDLQASLAGAKQRIAEAQSGIARFFRSATTAGSPIMGPNLLSARDLAAFVRAQGAKPQLTVSLDALAQMYIEEGQKVGVRGDVAFAQSIIETGYFGFRNSMVDPENNNFAGIGACDTCKRGFSFPDARTGVRAQVQLLRVYVDRSVTVGSLPDPLLLPGTLRLGFRGRVQTWWDLTGRWATAPNYGNAIYAVYNRMVAASGRR